MLRPYFSRGYNDGGVNRDERKKPEHSGCVFEPYPQG